MFEDSDKEWEKYGANDPYFGVISHDKFLTENINPEAMQEFWQSGQHDIEVVFDNIKRHIDADFKPVQTLDFGCGVGRVLFALSARSEHATGVDVSPSMLAEARAEAEKQGIGNVSLVQGNDCNELAKEYYCLVHSHIVLQHIPEKRGYAILDTLLASLRSGGIGALHFTFSNSRFRTWRLMRRLPFNKQIRNVMQGKPINAARMQMNEYDLNIIMTKIWSYGVRNCHLAFSDHGVLGAIIYFRKA